MCTGPFIEQLHLAKMIFYKYRLFPEKHLSINEQCKYAVCPYVRSFEIDPISNASIKNTYNQISSLFYDYDTNSGAIVDSGSDILKNEVLEVEYKKIIDSGVILSNMLTISPR